MAEELSRVAYAGKHWSELSTVGSGTELARGLKRQLQDDWLLTSNSIQPETTRHDCQLWGETQIEKFRDAFTGSTLDREQVRLAKTKEVEFLHTFQCTG